MGDKKSRRTRGWRALQSPRRATVTVIVLALVCVLAGSMLAQVGLRNRSGEGSKSASSDVSVMSFSPGSPAKEYVYAGGKLVATEEPVSGGCTPPSSPGNSLSAAAQQQPTLVVRLDWAVCSGAHHYEVQRKAHIGDTWGNLSPNPTSNSFVDNTASASTGYLYRIRAVDAASACPSDYSNTDLAIAVIFTDDPLQGHTTTIKALHITEVRQAVDAVRATASLSGATWTTNPLNPLSPVRAIQFSELRLRLNDALPSLGILPIPADSGIALGLDILATHLQAVREKVK